MNESLYQADANEVIDAVLRNAATGQVCVPATGLFEDWGASGHTRADYAIAHTGDDGLLFKADMPADVAEGDYFFVYTARAGANPADDDPYRGQSQVIAMGWRKPHRDYRPPHCRLHDRYDHYAVVDCLPQKRD